ncbi:MAG: hypothetical protein SNJ78_04070 [Spirochaetales bacterium]
MRINGIKCLLLVAIVLISSYAFGQAAPVVSYEDGTYRGGYGEVDNQVFIEFVLRNNVVQRIAYRNLAYRGIDYRTNKDETVDGYNYLGDPVSNPFDIFVIP